MPLGESIKSVVARVNSIGVTSPQPTPKPIGELLGMEVSAEDVELDKAFVESRKRQAVNIDALTLSSPGSCVPLKEAKKGEIFYTKDFGGVPNSNFYGHQLKCDLSTGRVDYVEAGYPIVKLPLVVYGDCRPPLYYVQGGYDAASEDTFRSICETTKAFQNQPTAPVVTSDPGAIAGGIIGGLAGGAIIGGLVGFGAYLARKYYKAHSPESYIHKPVIAPPGETVMETTT